MNSIDPTFAASSAPKSVLTAFDQTNSDVCDKCLVLLAWIAPPSLALSLLRIQVIGFQPLMGLQIAMVAALALIVIYRHRLSSVTRAGSLVLAYFLLGTGGILQFGSTTNAEIYLASFSLLAACFFGRRAGIGAIAFSTVFYGLVIGLQHAGYLPVTIWSGGPFDSIFALTAVAPFVIGTYAPLLTIANQLTAQRRAYAHGREIEDSLRASESLLESAQELAHVGSYDIDVTNRTAERSAEYVRILEIDPNESCSDEAIDQNFRSRIHPDDWNTFEALRLAFLGSIIRPGEFAMSQEIRLRMPDGRIKYVALHTQARTGADGRLIRVIGSVQDITERKFVESKVLDRERALRDAQAFARMGSWERDFLTGEIWCSDGFYHLYELERISDLPPGQETKRLMERIHPDDRARFMAEYDLATARQGTTEYRLMFPDGRIKHIFGVTTPQFDAAGTLVRITGTRQDVTDLRRAQARLEEAQALAHIGSYEFDVQTRRFSRSPEFLRICEIEPRGEVSFDQAKEVFLARMHPDDRERYQANMESLESHLGQGRTLETARSNSYRLILPSGQIKHVVINARFVLDTEERPSRIIGTLQDVTRQREAEEQLLRAQKMEAIGQLTAGVAHDFNNLLAVISGSLELLRAENPAESKTSQRADMALTAARRGAELTRHLLAYGRKQALTPEVRHLGESVAGAIDLLQRTLPHNIALRVSGTDLPVWVTVDAAQLENALINLSLNARDAMPGGGTLSFEVARVEIAINLQVAGGALSPGSYALIRIRDTGVGMTAEVLAKAFDPFFTTKAHGGGSGMGLSRVYGFVRQSGGRIQLESAVGQGATVSIYFPLAENEQSHGKIIPTVDSAPLPAARRRRVLLVEDMADVRETIKEQLETIDVEVDVAADGESALALLAGTKNFDVLLTDLGLPGAITGQALCQLARERRPRMKLLTMTGYNEDAGAQAGGPGAKHGHLRKPFTLKDLKDQLQGLAV